MEQKVKVIEALDKHEFETQMNRFIEKEAKIINNIHYNTFKAMDSITTFHYSALVLYEPMS